MNLCVRVLELFIAFLFYYQFIIICSLGDGTHTLTFSIESVLLVLVNSVQTWKMFGGF